MGSLSFFVPGVHSEGEVKNSNIILMTTLAGKYLRLFPSTVFAIILALGGCANAGPLVTMSPVGPKPPDVRPAGPLVGFLKVYSITREYNNGDIIYYPHRRYLIYSLDGKRLRTVDNRASRKDEEPQLVSLPVGKYYVVGRV